MQYKKSVYIARQIVNNCENMAYSDDQEENTNKTLVFTDEFWQEKARMFKTNERQTAFVRHLVENPGMTRTEAAKMAGYSGSPVALRVQATRAWGSNKIKAMFSACMVEQDLTKLDIATANEVLQWASKQMRQGVGQTQQKAAELLLKFHDTLEGQGHAKLPMPDLLTRLCDVGLQSHNPYLIASAIHSAGQDSDLRDWRPSETAVHVLKIYPAIIESLGDRNARYFELQASPGRKKNSGAAASLNGNGIPRNVVTTAP